MSMILNLQQVSEERLDALLADPDSVLGALEEPDGEVIDLDKAWHGLHFLFTGEAWGGEPPLDFLAVGGETVGEVDVGYGPARVLRPAAVQLIDDALAMLDEDDLRRRFDPAALTAAEIYPTIWEEGEQALEYLLGHYRTLRPFVAQAAEAGLGLLVYLT